MKKFSIFTTAFLSAAFLFSSTAFAAGAPAEQTPLAEPPLTEAARDAEAVTAVTVFSGTGSHGYTDGELATFHLPGAVTGDGKSIFVADTFNNLIREIDKDGEADTFSGDVVSTDDYRFPKGFYRDGSLGRALFNRPGGIVAAGRKRVYIADSANHVIRLAANNKVTTFAGGEAGYKDGKSYEAQFNNPTGMAIDGSGNLYVADTLNHVIRKIDKKGNVTTVAGEAGEAGYHDAGLRNSYFNSPMGVAVTEDGKTIYVADTGNHRIRMISGGHVTTVAGTTLLNDGDGEPLGGFADGANAEAMFSLPIGIVLYGDDLIVADSGNNRIRRVSPTEVTTLAGSGEPGCESGVTWLDASFNLPSGLYLNGNALYIADTANNMIRMVELEEEAELDD